MAIGIAIAIAIAIAIVSWMIHFKRVHVAGQHGCDGSLELEG